MPTGTVKWYSDQKGYGFIEPEDGSGDVFVHVSAVEKAGMRSLREGQKITYDLQNDPKKGKTSAANLQEDARSALRLCKTSVVLCVFIHGNPGATGVS